MIIIKRICRIVDFADPADRRLELKESEKRNNYQDLAREVKNVRNMKVTVIKNCYSCTRSSHAKIGKSTGGLGNRRLQRVLLSYGTRLYK